MEVTKYNTLPYLPQDRKCNDMAFSLRRRVCGMDLHPVRDAQRRIVQPEVWVCSLYPEHRYRPAPRRADVSKMELPPY